MEPLATQTSSVEDTFSKSRPSRRNSNASIIAWEFQKGPPAKEAALFDTYWYGMQTVLPDEHRRRSFSMANFEFDSVRPYKT
jgi:hypothetical protein